MRIPLSTALATPYSAFAVAAVFAVLVAIALRIAWAPPIHTYLEYVPVGVVFIVLIWDRLFSTWSMDGWPELCDLLVVGLALLRVIVPPLPFVSGHTLLTAYGALTARRWPLRAIALVVLAQVTSTKIFAGGSKTMLGGLAAAAIAAILHRRLWEAGAIRREQ
jgi:hypothetical protein